MSLCYFKCPCDFKWHCATSMPVLFNNTVLFQSPLCIIIYCPWASIWPVLFQMTQCYIYITLAIYIWPCATSNDLWLYIYCPGLSYMSLCYFEYTVLFWMSCAILYIDPGLSIYVPVLLQMTLCLYIYCPLAIYIWPCAILYLSLGYLYMSLVLFQMTLCYIIFHPCAIYIWPLLIRLIRVTLGSGFPTPTLTRDTVPVLGTGTYRPVNSRCAAKPAVPLDLRFLFIKIL